MPRSEIIGGTKALKIALFQQLKDKVLEIQSILTPQIELLLRSRLKEHFDNNDTINSILGQKDGDFSLKQEFGLTDELALSSAVQIIDTIVNSVSVRFVQKKTKVIELGQIEISIIPGDFQKNLANTVGLYVSEKSGSDILWLNWLLTQGTRIIIDDYRVGKSGSLSSRAGGALMRKGGFYRVNPKHAGTVDDNFITRGINEVLPLVISDIEGLIEKL